MSRILEALKQIDAKLPRAPQPSQAPPGVKNVDGLASEPPVPPPTETPPPMEKASRAGPRQEMDEDALGDRQLRLAQTPPVESVLPTSAKAALGEAEQKVEYQQTAKNILAQLAPCRAAVLMFAGADGTDDVSGIVARLAAALARQVTEEVVVVDCDFDRPRLAEQFELQTRRSLIDVLTGGAEWGQVVCRTDVANLHVLPGDRFPTGDGQAPQRVSLAPLLNQLRRHFRLVVIQAGRLSHGEISRLARHCDATYLLVQLHCTPRGAARRAIRLVERCGGQVAGCVLING